MFYVELSFIIKGMLKRIDGLLVNNRTIGQKAPKLKSDVFLLSQCAAKPVILGDNGMDKLGTTPLGVAYL